MFGIFLERTTRISSVKLMVVENLWLLSELSRDWAYFGRLDPGDRTTVQQIALKHNALNGSWGHFV